MTNHQGGTFSLTIRMDNAAFQGADDDDSGAEGAEVARILRHVAEQVDDSMLGDGGNVFDTNGNKVGAWTVER